MTRSCLYPAAFCLSLAFGSTACANESAGPPAPPTLSQRLQGILDDTLRAHDGTGVSAALLIPGEQPWVGTSGRSHGSVAITAQTLFGVSSVTKVYVAALALRLAEEGLLGLDDSLRQWLGSYAHVDSTITIRQLLNHTSGVYDFVEHPLAWDSILYDPSRLWSAGEIVTSFVSEPYFRPGAGFHYSNTGYLLVGMIIEAATGSDVSAALRNRFWDPLALRNTFFDVEEAIPGELAHPWIDAGNDGVLDDFSSVPRTAASSASWTAGAIIATALDLAQWGRALYGGAILSDASLAQMLAETGSGYGLGTDLILGEEHFNGEPAVGHAGSGLGFASVLAYLHNLDVSVAVLMNDNNLDCMFAIASALVEAVTDHVA
ncbi:MAG: beta-lactamase family protein [Gemmatimonadota bacterium]|nr:MAG: beta-lactamase family protein [Gemmatimonadota bacterium]